MLRGRQGGQPPWGACCERKGIGDSWVVRENLAALAAIAVRFGHVALNLACAPMDSPLLRDDCLFVEAAGLRAFILQGCYLTWDDVRKQWVRSGKVTGIPPRSVVHARRSTWRG